MNTLEEIVKEIESDLNEISINDFNQADLDYTEKQNIIVTKHLDSMPQEHNIRINTEYFSYGPLSELIENSNITEILVNSLNDIWFERSGKLQPLNDIFLTQRSFRKLLTDIYKEGTPEPTLERPFSDGVWMDFRVHIVLSSKVSKETVLSLRRKAGRNLNLDGLRSSHWAPQSVIQKISDLVRSKKNILVIGPTGTGKTTVISSFLETIPPEERTVIIEDTDEIRRPNRSSVKLLTRFDSNAQLPDIDLSLLLKNALRMRPDRLVLGEVRGAEAKDLLLTLATGHAGGMTSLHANNAQEALIRLEMLVQLGAPQWSLHSIRKLLALSLDYIITIERTDKGRTLRSLHKISSFEETGLTMECIYDA